MLTGNCHCGAVSIEVPERPRYLIECNCSICRRNGALWALYPSKAVRVVVRAGNTSEYVWGARKIKTIHCRTCGCTTHWEPLQCDADSEFGVNMRNFDPKEIEAVATRQFDGAETWSYRG